MVHKINAIIAVIIIGTYITVLGNLLIPFQIPYKEYAMVLPLFLLFILLNIPAGITFQRIIVNKYLLYCSPLLFGYFFESIRYIFNYGEKNILEVYILFINLIATLFIMAYFLSRGNQFKLLVRYYFNLNVFIATSAVSIFALLVIGIFDLESWTLPGFYGNAFQRKIDYYGGSFSYYAPFYITIIASYSRELGQLGSFGAFTGLSYEPHIAGFFMGPAFFMIDHFHIKSPLLKKGLIYFCFILFFLIATSLTNLLALVVVLVVRLISTTIKSPRIAVYSLIGIAAVLLSFYVFFGEYLDLFFKYAEYKFGSRSQEETAGFLSYMFSPVEILGDGIFNFPVETIQRDVSDIGYVGMLIFVGIYLSLIIPTMKIIFFSKKDKWIGFACLYFIIHSLKFPFHVIQYPIILFIYSLIVYSHTNENLQLDLPNSS